MKVKRLTQQREPICGVFGCGRAGGADVALRTVQAALAAAVRRPYLQPHAHVTTAGQTYILDTVETILSRKLLTMGALQALLVSIIQLLVQEVATILDNLFLHLLTCIIYRIIYLPFGFRI